MLRKYLNPRVAPYRDVSATLRAFGVYGARARDVVADAFGVHAAARSRSSRRTRTSTAPVADVAVRVARVPDLGLDGFQVFVPADGFDAVWERLASAAPARSRGGWWRTTIARVEAGWPEWGVDIDDTTIPQEANFDELHAISYTKGCYTGQETVARVHFRGHVNRHLRGLLFDDSSALPARRRARGRDGQDGRRRALGRDLAAARRRSRSRWCGARCRSARRSSRACSHPPMSTHSPRRSSRIAW